MLKKSLFSLVALMLTLTFIAPQPDAYAGNNDYRVRARMSGSTLMSGQANYRERTKKGVFEQRFNVQVEDGDPGASVVITLNGSMTIGTIVLDDFGFGELQLRTETFIDDPGDGSPIPTDFPTILIGDTVSVGPVSGVFD